MPWAVTKITRQPSDCCAAPPGRITASSLQTSWADRWRQPTCGAGSSSPCFKRAGLPGIRFHDLRHTAATLLLGEGVHPKIVSERLGHSRVGITLDLYSHVTPTMQREAAASVDAVLRDR